MQYTTTDDWPSIARLFNSDFSQGKRLDNHPFLRSVAEATALHAPETDVLARGNGPSCDRRPSSMFNIGPTA
jgi:hypothetical protein